MNTFMSSTTHGEWRMTEQEQISLRQYFEQRLNAIEKAHEDWLKLWREERARGLQEIAMRAAELEKRLNERAESTEKALAKADKDMEARLLLMNEFRATIESIITRLPTREEMAALVGSLRTEMTTLLAAMEKRLREVELWASNIQGRLMVVGGVWGLLVVILSILINFAIRKAFGE